MTSTRAPEADTDPALIAAVGVARAAAREQAGADVGEHVAVLPEDAAAATHLFEAELPGYLGWRWAVTVASGGPGTEVTVSEVVLLPGPDALVAPPWVPWHERVRPGDMGVGDLLPTAPDDDRLVAGYVASDDPALEELALEVGLGRPRVLSREGRLDAADRWKNGDFGPGADMAKGAPAHCGTCGFYSAVAGSLGAAFGVCANEIAPADGRVVHAEYGCGAHSEAEVEQVSPVLVADLMYDDSVLDVEITPRTEVPDGEQLADVAEVPAVDEAAPAETDGGRTDLAPEAEAVVGAADTTAPTAVATPEEPAAPAEDGTAADTATAADPAVVEQSVPEVPAEGGTVADTATAADPVVAEQSVPEVPAEGGTVADTATAADPVVADQSAPEVPAEGGTVADAATAADPAVAEQAPAAGPVVDVADLATPDHTVAVDAFDPAAPVDDLSAEAPTGSTEPADADDEPVDPAAAVAAEDTGTEQAVAAVAQGEVAEDGSGQPEPDDRG